MAAISSGPKMADAEILENQNENRRTDELQETRLELEVQAANRRIECVDRRKCRVPGVRLEAGERSSSAMISRIGNAVSCTTDFRCGDAVVISTRLRHGTSALLRHVQKLCAHPGKWLPSTRGLARTCPRVYLLD